MDRVVEVAAAILTRSDASFLLAQRPPHKPYGGYWEFPGGKMEAHESPLQTLRRELREELGIDVELAYPWIARRFDYPHARVRLHFFRVHRWSGDPRGHEGQSLAWQSLENLSVAPLLPANAPVMRALSLPSEYAVSNAGIVGSAAFLANLRRRLAGGLRLLQLREPDMAPLPFRELAAAAVRLAHEAGARVLLNGSAAVASELGADGIHLRASDLGSLHHRPAFSLVGASVHSAMELRRAEALGADFAVLGSVSDTPTHPRIETLGWQGFGDIARDTAIPVYAIGGMLPDDLELAWQHGAHGLAMIRGSWDPATPGVESVRRN